MDRNPVCNLLSVKQNKIITVLVPMSAHMFEKHTSHLIKQINKINQLGSKDAF